MIDWLIFPAADLIENPLKLKLFSKDALQQQHIFMWFYIQLNPDTFNKLLSFKRLIKVIVRLQQDSKTIKKMTHQKCIGTKHLILQYRVFCGTSCIT